MHTTSYQLDPQAAPAGGNTLMDPSGGFQPGLCGTCVHARRIESARGSVFLLCGLSSTDPRFARYPRLPVVECAGYARVSDAGAAGDEGES
jgi:hypothetical protein